MSPPLMEWLAALPADVVRLPLAGLDLSATSDLVRSVLAYEPAAAMVEELHARTGGNPLFVKECAQLLAAQGGSATLVVPDRVRQVITRRVARLQRKCVHGAGRGVGGRRLRPRSARGTDRHDRCPRSPTGSARRSRLGSSSWTTTATGSRTR